jgi:hypothetical protein
LPFLPGFRPDSDDFLALSSEQEHKMSRTPEIVKRDFMFRTTKWLVR